jgi:hypothetical protein
MLRSYAARDHYGIDQAKEGLVMAPDPAVRNGGTGYMEIRIQTPPVRTGNAPPSRKGCACHAVLF